jgi:L-ascorbate metabolism protein UlaG (beta-lactamase superfamily)
MNSSQITFLGHASFQVKTSTGKIILVDPWLGDNPVCPPEYKEHTHVDLVLITHGHSDHFDKDLPNLLRRTGATVVAHPEVRTYLDALGIENIEPMNKGGTIEVLGCKVTMTHALHCSYIESGEDMVGPSHEAAGYILQTPDNLRIYFAGDTAIFGDMKLLGEIYRPNIAALPIGDRYTMGPLEAAYAIRLLEVKHIIPIHYGTFASLTGTPDALRELTKDIESLHIHALKPGETLGGEIVLAI